MKKPPSNGSKLKSKGLIPKEWDLRYPTNYQKRVISKRARDYKEVLSKPQHFVVRKVSPKTATNLKLAGYEVSNNRAIIPLIGTAEGAKVCIKGDRLTITKRDRIETVYLSTGKDFIKRLEKLNFTDELDENEFWSLKVGDSNTFFHQSQSLNNLLHRYAPTIKWHKEGADKYVALVKVKFTDEPKRFIPIDPVITDSERRKAAKFARRYIKGRGPK